MTITPYSSLKEKSAYFDCEEINTKNDFDNLANYWTDGKDKTANDAWRKVIFRGLPEAKYKLYNSAQRCWNGQELYKLGRTYQDFIQIQIDSAKKFQAYLLLKFYRAFGHPAYDLSILSFLQHYGAPTPLMDFSYRFNTAAFFATDGLIQKPSSDIENYFSIYAINISDLSKVFPSIIDHISSSLQQVDDILENNKEKNINIDSFIQEFEELKYKTFHELILFYIPGFNPQGYSFKLRTVPHFNLVFNQHNLNIINQEGLFVFNSDEINPLEYHFSGELIKGRISNLPKIKCYNVHKSLNEYVVRYLTENRLIPIDKSLMFPQEEYIAKNAFQQFKNFKL